MLNFPNASRYYDARQRRVRFWAHDAALEVQFLVDAAALLHLDPGTGANEAGLLMTFDLNRPAIEIAAARAYKRHERDSYILVASDFP